MNLIGRRGHKSEAYPVSPGLGGMAALRNRIVVPIQALPAFTPGVTGSPTLVGATLVTPVASGQFLVLASSLIGQPSDDETFGLTAIFATGSDLVISGGSLTVGSWRFGTSTPVVLSTSTQQASLTALAGAFIPSGKAASLVSNGVNDVALPIGVPSALTLFIGQTGGGHAISGGLTMQVTLIELP